MFDFAWSELALIAAVALVVIGPKDLPRTLRIVGQWVRKARAIAREFQGSLDQMVREAELDDIKRDIDRAANFDFDRDIRQAIDPGGELQRSLSEPVLTDPLADEAAEAGRRGNTVSGRSRRAGRSGSSAGSARSRSGGEDAGRGRGVTDAKDELDEGKMPLLDHLIELRKRLLYSFVALIVMFGPCWYFSKTIYNFLAQPLANALSQQAGRHLIFTDLTEAFFTDLRVAFWAAFCLAFPIIASQIWLFVAPGLYKQERRAFLPYLVASPLLFIMGGALVYYVIFPVAWRFFLSFESPGGNGTLPIEVEPKVSEYLTLVMRLMLAFGVAFQLPVLLDPDGAGRPRYLSRPRQATPLRDRHACSLSPRC